MGFIEKYKTHVLFFFLISAIYFILRLAFIDKLPIFTDEAIYTRWAQIALNDSNWRFISLTDGKQPMFVWAAVVFMKFIQDPLISARLVSVFAGFFTLIGLFLLTLELFRSERTAFLAALLYVFYPFAQVLDRMALYDSMVGTFFVWALYLSVHLVKKIRLDIAYTLGFVIGAGVLTKTSNFFSIYLLPFTLVLFDFSKKPYVKRLLKFLILATFSALIGYGLYNILRLSPLFQMISAKDAVFVYTFNEWLTHPFTFFIGNLNGLFSWLTEYLKAPYIILILVALIFFRRYTREKILLVIYFLLPFIALALFGRVIFPRFIFFMTLALIPLCAWGLNYILLEVFRYTEKRQKAQFMPIVTPLVIFVFIWYPALVSLQFAVDPVNADIAKADNAQYANSWAVGWGVKETIEYFEGRNDEKIFIATEGTFGLMPYALEMYLLDNKNITIKGYWPVKAIPKEVLTASQKMPTYFVFYQRDNQNLPSNFPLKLIFKIRQGESDTYYRLYQVVPK